MGFGIVDRIDIKLYKRAVIQALTLGTSNSAQDSGRI
jgi:hypothetical protein